MILTLERFLVRINTRFSLKFLLNHNIFIVNILYGWLTCVQVEEREGAKVPSAMAGWTEEERKGLTGREMSG